MGIKPDNYFILKDGKVIKNLYELSKALEYMPDEVFKHHVNEGKNDFYSWANDVIKDKILADKINSAKDRKEIQKYVSEKISKNAVKNNVKIKLASKPEPAKKVQAVKKSKLSEREIAGKMATIISAKKENPAVEVYGRKSADREEITKKFTSLFSAKKDELKIGPRPEKTMLGINCPCKTIRCGILEFVFGIIIGLLLALLISRII